jgi:ubiquinone biosynthesis monooxygenase Coq7
MFIHNEENRYPSDQRNYSLLDRAIIQFDKALRTIYADPSGSERQNPSDRVDQPMDLSDSERDLSGRLMRVNHAGEISAQGLYQGQSLTARRTSVRNQMEKSSEEENEHLWWCDQRLKELGSYKSYLNPIWYFGSFTLGAIAGLAGDRWSLGFVKETERQVVNHLETHLDRLPLSDHKSQAILDQMRVDEAHHAHVATSAGAAELPTPIKKLMTLASKIMTQTAYWI